MMRVTLTIVGPKHASLSGISSVSDPVVVVENVAVDGIWLHEAWPQDGRQSYYIHMKNSLLNACELDLCMLKGLQSNTSSMSKPWNRLKPSHQNHLWLNRASSLE